MNNLVAGGGNLLVNGCDLVIGGVDPMTEASI